MSGVIQDGGGHGGNAMTVYSGASVVTPDGVLPDGWVSVSDGRVVAVGDGRSPAPETDLGDVAIVNTGSWTRTDGTQTSWSCAGRSRNVKPMACGPAVTFTVAVMRASMMVRAS